MATPTTVQFIPPGGLPPATPVGTDGVTTLGSIADEAAAATQSLAGFRFADFYTDQNGFLRKLPANVGILPEGLTLNGGVFMGPDTGLPAGLSSNGGVIMTDGSVFYPGTWANGGVLTLSPYAAAA